MQGHLNTGLLLWWTRKHGCMFNDKLSAADRNQIGDTIRGSVDVVYAVINKVGLSSPASPFHMRLRCEYLCGKEQTISCIAPVK